MSKSVNHAQVLGVSDQASYNDVCMAYKKWLKAYNPNRENNPDERWAKQQVRKKIDRSYLALVSSKKPAKKSH